MKPGSSQQITVKAHPGLKVTIGTTWPDNKTHPEWGAQILDSPMPTGEFVLRWAIPVNAPTGNARTDVAVAGKIEGQPAYAFAQPSWRIARSC
ncbi:MAG: hypothetical protein ABR507_01100 [Actinomycetota bacterium]|nr:hypothetical protein [Actinomycetota bacterium]